MTNYAYAYAVIRDTDGICYHVMDTTNYIENQYYIPLDVYNGNYLAKYYYPIPTEHGDFNGKWYIDSTHQTEWIPE